LNRTLNPESSQPPLLPVSSPQTALAEEATAFLSSSPAEASVTERTTRLLAKKLKVREKEPVNSKRRDTSPLD
jgi:hypothetical protein